MTSTTELCMHELEPSTCSVCKYADMPSVYTFGRSTRYHADAECGALRAERDAVKKRGGVMPPVVTARPGSSALDGRTACEACA